MIRRRMFLLPLAAACSPFAQGNESRAIEPLWEVQLRLQEQADFGLSSWFRDKLPQTDQVSADGLPSAIRLTGVNHPATMESGWLLELSGLKDAAALRTKLGERAKPDEAGRFLIHGDGGSFIAWMEKPDVFHWAFPAANGGVVVPPTIVPSDGEFLSGWVDLEKVTDDQTNSKLLRTIKHVRFSASARNEMLAIRLDVHFRDALSSAAFQERFSLLQKAIQPLLTDSQGNHQPAPKAVPTDDGLRLSLELNRRQVEALKRFIDGALDASTEGEGSTASPATE